MAEDAEIARVPQRRVGSVKDAITILRYLDSRETPVGVNQIARDLDLSPSSCFNLLKTLVDEQFVDFDGMTKLYSLGSGSITLGRRALDPKGTFEMVRERLEALADRRSVTAGLWRPRRGDQLILIGFAESAAAFRIQLSVGQRLPIATGASGRCVMAFSQLDEAEIRRRFAAVKWGQTPDFKAFLSDLAEARANHWAIDESNFVKGVTTVASPCLGPEGTTEYVVTATMFTGQYPRGRLEQIADELRGQAEWLRARLFKAGRI